MKERGKGDRVRRLSSKLSRSDLLAQRRALPIFAARDALVQQFREHKRLVIMGETGSGKTTQIPQFLLASGLIPRYKRIAVTQPRRVAAITLAQRVADEHGCALGDAVGYQVRFEDVSSAETRIKFVTDGMLLRESILDPLLSSYACIIIDEAHERTLHTDVLLAVIRQALRKRNDLRIIVMSATLDAEKFSRYFDAEIVYVAGRQYPVELYYADEPQEDYIDSTINAILQIHVDEPAGGDVLAFLTGQDEIEGVTQILREKNRFLSAPLHIIRLYAALPPEAQLEAFAPAPRGHRKIVLATNIAETSVTIPNIRYVIDCGLVKARLFHPGIGLDSLSVVPISQAAAKQRTGRAGRDGPGKCFRLYTREAFRDLPLATVPEMLRSNLATITLQLKAMGIDDILSLEFVDEPTRDALVRAVETLILLGAIDRSGKLTERGSSMAALPLDPKLAAMLIAAQELQCRDDALTLAAMLSIENVYFGGASDRSKADRAREGFRDTTGDHVTLVRLFHAYKRGGKSSEWCVAHFVNARAMRRAADIRAQLADMLDGDAPSAPSLSTTGDSTRLRSAIARGFFTNAAVRQPDGSYRAVATRQTLHMHPGSVLFRAKPKWVIYNEAVVTAKQYMRNVVSIEAQWLRDAAPEYFASVRENA